MSDVVVGIDLVEVDQTLSMAEREAQARVRAIGTSIRRTIQVGVFATQALLGVTNQALNMLVEAIGVSIDFVTRLMTISTLSPFGLVKTGLLGLQVVLLLNTANQIRMQKAANTTAANGLINTLRVLAI